MEAYKCSDELNKSEAPIKPASGVSPSPGAKPNHRPTDAGIGDSDVVKFCVLTQGDLSAPAMPAEVVEATR